MANEIAGAVASIRLLMDVIKANKALANYNELVAAVSEVNADLISAQAAAVTSQRNEMMLTEQVRELKQKIVTLENWEREAERYALGEVAPHVFAYCLKPSMENGEPPHKLCANCYGKREKSILQAEWHNILGDVDRCPRCSTLLLFPGPGRSSAKK